MKKRLPICFIWHSCGEECLRFTKTTSLVGGRSLFLRDLLKWSVSLGLRACNIHQALTVGEQTILCLELTWKWSSTPCLVVGFHGLPNVLFTLPCEFQGLCTATNHFLVCGSSPRGPETQKSALSVDHIAVCSAFCVDVSTLPETNLTWILLFSHPERLFSSTIPVVFRVLVI